MLVVTQLGDNRRLLLETQVQQDLRAALDIVVRDLRRARYWDQSWRGVALPDDPASVTPNPYGPPEVTGATGSNVVRYSYRRDTVTSFGFRLQNGVLQSLMGDGSWQALTDGEVLRVTAFSIELDRTNATANDTVQVLPCVRECADGSTDCWPTTRVQQLIVTVTAAAVADPAFVRTVSAGVRLRNDSPDIDPGLAATGRTCPG
jgi:type IV pilus assembly protein PilW